MVTTDPTPKSPQSEVIAEIIRQTRTQELTRLILATLSDDVYESKTERIDHDETPEQIAVRLVREKRAQKEQILVGFKLLRNTEVGLRLGEEERTVIFGDSEPTTYWVDAERGDFDGTPVIYYQRDDGRDHWFFAPEDPEEVFVSTKDGGIGEEN